MAAFMAGMAVAWLIAGVAIAVNNFERPARIFGLVLVGWGVVLGVGAFLVRFRVKMESR